LFCFSFFCFVVFPLCSWCSAVIFGGSFDDGGPCSADGFVLFPVAHDLFFGSLGWFCLVRAVGWLLGDAAVLVVGAFWFAGGVCNGCLFLGGYSVSRFRS
jgi:hypothetical protein